MSGPFFDAELLALLASSILSKEEADEFRSSAVRRTFQDPAYGDAIVVYIRDDGAFLFDSYIEAT